MKLFLVPLFISVGLAQPAFGQTQTFDIATFVSPRGWSQTQSNGILIVQDHRTVQGRVQFCQIYLFPSQPSSASATANFQAEWDAKVARKFGLASRIAPQPTTSPNGWTSLTDRADVVNQGVPLRVLLLTATGFGRYVSVIVSVSPNSYQAELMDFFKNLDLRAPAAGPVSPSSGPGTDESSGGSNRSTGSSANASLASYVYVTPPSWSQQQSRDRILLTSPMYSNGEACQLAMFPWRSSSQPLTNEAIGTFRAVFQTDPLTTYPSPPPTIAKGTSPQGWEYVTIRKLVGGQEGEARTKGAILLVARVDGQVATIAGTSKDFMVSNCFGLLRGDLWPKFFSTLQFKNAPPSGPEHTAIQQRLAGRWITATGSAGLQYTFDANGRYADTVATQYRTPISSNEVLQTTTAFFGNGGYSFDGNMLLLKRDDNKRFAFLFRLEQVSKDSGRTWADELCLMETGSTGEVCYRKE
jgi:hypothetical protein